MRCLTESEACEWLSKIGMSSDPYSESGDSRYYIQFHQPKLHKEKEAFARGYIEAFVDGGEALLHLTDWGLYTKGEMLVVDEIRALAGERRRLIVAPACLFGEDYVEEGIMLFGLTGSFEWTAYLHSADEKTSLLNWEGEIYDFWTSSLDCLNRMVDLLKVCGLEKVSE